MPSIQSALIVRLLVSVSAVIAAATVGLAWILRLHLQAQFDEGLAGKARVLAAFVHQNEQGRLEMELEDVPMAEFDRPDGEYFVVWNGRDVQFRSRSLGQRTLPPIDGYAGRSAFRDRRLPDGRPGRAVWISFSPRIEPGESAPAAERERSALPTSETLTIAVARERQTLDTRITDLNIEVGAMGLLLLVIIPLVITRVVPRSLRPLEDLARQATAIEATSLGQRFPTDGLPIELAAITARLNELLDRLAKSFERERRFSADVAHELRTPIAELRTLAEVALADDRRPGEDRSLLYDVRDAAIQMQSLVTNLLALARCQSGHQPIKLECVDVSVALLRAWSGFQPAAVDKGLEIVVQASVAANARADAALLEVVLSNLLGNATTYVPVGGRVDLSATPEGDHVTIAIANTTESIVKDDLPHLFEPFWRKDPARTDGNHSGLGLSLVAAMLSVMGGKVQAALNAPGWIQFVVTLPGA